MLHLLRKLGPCLMSGEGLAAGLGDEDIAKDLLLLNADEEKIWSRAILGVDSTELVRVLELGLSAGCFCHDDDDYINSLSRTSYHIADAKGHGVMRDNALSALRTDAD